jgi:hypothetical protein
MADKKIAISLDNWECLEPYLPSGVCPKQTHDDAGFPMQDCRFANEAEYQEVLALAEKHCPALVQQIKASKVLSEEAERKLADRR